MLLDFSARNTGLQLLRGLKMLTALSTEDLVFTENLPDLRVTLLFSLNSVSTSA